MPSPHTTIHYAAWKINAYKICQYSCNKSSKSQACHRPVTWINIIFQSADFFSSSVYQANLTVKKNPENFGHPKNYCDCPKIRARWFYYGMVKGVYPDQTAPNSLMFAHSHLSENLGPLWYCIIHHHKFNLMT